MRKRTKSREIALQALYQIDIAKSEVEAALAHLNLNKEDPEVKSYSQSLVKGVIEKKDAIDKIIERFADNWEIKRMAYVDRNILRLSTYEMLFTEDIPMKVVINEAVELAKRFGESDSSKFVNGVLDKIAKAENPDKKSEKPEEENEAG